MFPDDFNHVRRYTGFIGYVFSGFFAWKPHFANIEFGCDIKVSVACHAYRFSHLPLKLNIVLVDGASLMKTD